MDILSFLNHAFKQQDRATKFEFLNISVKIPVTTFSIYMFFKTADNLIQMHSQAEEFNSFHVQSRQS